MITGSKRNYFLAIFFFIIALISIFFHYPIHITDALTLEALPEYDIKIPIWRMVFEPFLGLLLFFNRSLYALTEIQFLLYWMLAIFIIYVIIKIITKKRRRSRKKYALRQLANIPILIGLWFVLLALIIFIPLPNNTIVNNVPNTILVTTHAHTEYSHDGLISQEGLWKWHKRNGFDAFFITEHNNHDKTLDFVDAQRNHEFPIEPLVICGEEFSGSNHLSLLGLKRKFSTRGSADTTVIDSVRAGNGVVLVNHWYDGERMSLEYFRNIGVDGFEIENTATDRTYDREVYQRVKEFCETNQLFMNGGLDFHGYGNVCSLWNAFEIPGWHQLDPTAKEEAILNVIRTRDQSKVSILQYKDRPYYSETFLFLSPIFTSVSYFRTLNFYQLTSWAAWLFLIAFALNRVSRSKELIKACSIDQMIPIKGIFGALFLLVLGLVYYSRIQEIEGFTEMYDEYSTLLFYIGSVLLIYSGFVLFFRNKMKQKEIEEAL